MARRRYRLAWALALLVSSVLWLAAPRARAIDVITFEELKELALKYGKISQRFVTCKMEPPGSIRVAFLKYARSRGASEQHLEILSELFSEGQARVRNLRTGFSPEECKAKIESPEGQELLRTIEKWYGDGEEAAGAEAAAEAAAGEEAGRAATAEKAEAAAEEAPARDRGEAGAAAGGAAPGPSAP